MDYKVVNKLRKQSKRSGFYLGLIIGISVTALLIRLITMF